MSTSSRAVRDINTPVRQGDRYCSPSCGGGCTWKEYQQAVRDADQLVKQLRGEGWKPVVWENLGWHFQAVSGPVQVYGDRRGPGGKLRYSCMISDKEEGSGGSSIWTNQDARSYADPNDAVEVEFLAAAKAAIGVVRAVSAAAKAAGRTVEHRVLEAVLAPNPRLAAVDSTIDDKRLEALVRSPLRKKKRK